LIKLHFYHWLFCFTAAYKIYLLYRQSESAAQSFIVLGLFYKAYNIGLVWVRESNCVESRLGWYF